MRNCKVSICNASLFTLLLLLSREYVTVEVYILLFHQKESTRRFLASQTLLKDILLFCISSQNVLHGRARTSFPSHKRKKLYMLYSYSVECLFCHKYDPIEQYWALVKGKRKRHRLMNEENLSQRIADACNNALFSDLQGFYRHSKAKSSTAITRQASS
ncbi:hypothetical protein EDC94DRAFT_565925 [Helicostylum pulchrum]|nr:hypothetical protein EDC94DRAFT_565925 [Helicostylum pulchrum]